MEAVHLEHKIGNFDSMGCKVNKEFLMKLELPMIILIYAKLPVIARALIFFKSVPDISSIVQIGFLSISLSFWGVLQTGKYPESVKITVVN